MTKSDFLKSIIAVSGLSFIPSHWQTPYTKFYLLQCFVAGFRFYEGVKLLPEMKTGDLLYLKREPNNEHDSKAIALYWKNIKIGFVPADVNEMLARLIDGEALTLHAEITHINAEAKEWEHIHFAIYFLKEKKNTYLLPKTSEYLTIVETPEYFSIRSKDDIITRIENKRDQGQEQIVVNVNNLGENFKDLKLRNFANEYHQEDSYFSKPGYRILKDEDIEELLPFVKEINVLADDIQEYYTELIIEAKEMQNFG